MGDYFRYWGKANAENGLAFHLLPYHCLDVVAIAHEWWQQSKVIRNHFVAESGLSETEAYAWVMFFIVLHDLGKFDVRFQLKARDVALQLWPEFVNADESLSRHYYHGAYSSYWIFQDLDQRFDWADDFGDEDKWEAWQPWLFAVAGHHGVMQSDIYGLDLPRGDSIVIDHDKRARLAFINEMETMFLMPAALSLDDNPPPVDQDFLAGFCSACDWLGSMEINGTGDSRFHYVSHLMPLNDYFTSRSDIAKQVLQESGLFHAPRMSGGMAVLFPQYTPRLVQVLVDDLPVQAGLTIIEAPTGSGKTEAALAYASRLLAAGVAESIIFALPTQATANAMFDRLLDVTEKMYQTSNLLLAHGKARFNEQFMDMKGIASKRTPQDSQHETEATVQCSQWLGQSRKRVFLGQVGVCTIDQVLISVLPVKHKFVRSFGLGKSILIVDEVHAYDSYMYGLLQEVLRRQRQMLGSAILLSATLPGYQKESLVAAWGGCLEQQSADTPYPLISHYSGSMPVTFTLPENEMEVLRKSAREVHVDVIEKIDMHFDDELLGRVVQAARSGANVALICNLVADAQATARRLIEMGGHTVNLFHSRFRFLDRQIKEGDVLAGYGKGKTRKKGGILVATQVVEQSLDLDFDWMLTQLCPIDSLFQRLGRLHRHERARPQRFERPQCTIVVPINHDYGVHALIYGGKKAPNTCILWRTEQRIRAMKVMRFPEVYRPEIELVYQEEAWANEPQDIQDARELFMQEQQGAHITAKQLANSNTHFEDSDASASVLTRDGEMSLNVIPVIESGRSRLLLDGVKINQINEWQLAEVLSMNTVPVPASWRSVLPQGKDGVIWLPMQEAENGAWECRNGSVLMVYSIENGLERKEL